MTENRTIPKNSVALIISRERGAEEEDYMLDLQVIPPEADLTDGYLTSVANLAVNLLEQAMFGGDDEGDEEEDLDLLPGFLDDIDLGYDLGED
jgi:hypothetical protein